MPRTITIPTWLLVLALVGVLAWAFRQWEKRTLSESLTKLLQELWP